MLEVVASIEMVARVLLVTTLNPVVKFMIPISFASWLPSSSTTICGVAVAFTVLEASITTPLKVRSVPSKVTFLLELPKVNFPPVRSRKAPDSLPDGPLFASGGAFAPELLSVPPVIAPKFALKEDKL